jgi:large subunit ribosomal protein L25
MNAQPRDRAGKGAARAARRAGFVPAVIYGDKKDPRLVNLDPAELRKSLEGGSFFATVYSLKVGDATERVIPRDVQMHPVRDTAQHVDFLRVSALTRVTVEVPVNFTNEEECAGLKRGGVLNVVRYGIEVVCGVDDIPQSFDVDLAGLDIGDSVHASTLALPSGVELTITDRDFTIATVAAPTVVAEEEAEAAEAAEGEEAEGVEGEEGAETPAEGAEGEGEKKEEE